MSELSSHHYWRNPTCHSRTDKFPNAHLVSVFLRNINANARIKLRLSAPHTFVSSCPHKFSVAEGLKRRILACFCSSLLKPPLAYSCRFLRRPKPNGVDIVLDSGVVSCGLLVLQACSWSGSRSVHTWASRYTLACSRKRQTSRTTWRRRSCPWTGRAARVAALLKPMARRVGSHSQIASGPG